MCYSSLMAEVVPWLDKYITPPVIPCQYRVKTMILVCDCRIDSDTMLMDWVRCCGGTRELLYNTLTDGFYTAYTLINKL